MTKCSLAYLHLLKHLASERWQPGDRIPSLRQLAVDLQISTKPCLTALRRAASEGLVEVEEKSRARVLPGAGDHAKDLLAGMADDSGSRRVAVLAPSWFFPLTGAPFQSEVCHTIVRELTKHGLVPQIVPIPSEDQVGFARRIAAGFNIAVVVGLTVAELNMLFALRHQCMPVLLLNRQVPGQDIPTVNFDDCGAARRLAQLLIRMGHRNMCLIGNIGYEFLDSARTKSDGWVGALREAGVLGDCVLPVMNYAKWDFAPALRHVLSIKPRITALVLNHAAMFNDIIAEDLFRGLRVPEDISVATPSIAHYFPSPPGWPPCTSFELNMARLGEIVAASVEGILRGAPQPPNIRLPLDIVITDSVGPPPKAGLP
ncbi:MAG TPA: GntR family transcriptional regulator [Phycisphaerae bacterium]|nr:GntR family transcriptional regulator [Phycisphaerae bacterium]HOI55415.1 GntR family transcriptional regulator [Phycisphaerae bacterium]